MPSYVSSTIHSASYHRSVAVKEIVHKSHTEEIHCIVGRGEDKVVNPSEVFIKDCFGHFHAGSKWSRLKPKHLRFGRIEGLAAGYRDRARTRDCR